MTDLYIEGLFGFLFVGQSRVFTAERIANGGRAILVKCTWSHMDLILKIYKSFDIVKLVPKNMFLEYTMKR